MNVLSRYLMVTGGNVTDLTDQLEREGLVRHETDPNDCQPFHVLLISAGHRHFTGIATEHERQPIEMFDGLGVTNRDALYTQLGHLHVHLAQCEQGLNAREDQP